MQIYLFISAIFPNSGFQNMQGKSYVGIFTV